MSKSIWLPKWTDEYPKVQRLCNADSGMAMLASTTVSDQDRAAQMLIRIAERRYGYAAEQAATVREPIYESGETPLGNLMGGE